MEERMTICNMAIEGGGKSGIIAPDETTFEYVRGKRFAPEGEEFEKKVSEWKELYTDSVEAFDKHIKIDVSNLEPQVTWSTNPEMGINITGTFPEIKDHNDEKAYEYMGLKPGQTHRWRWRRCYGCRYGSSPADASPSCSGTAAWTAPHAKARRRSGRFWSA